jgi:hypothetical protein
MSVSLAEDSQEKISAVEIVAFEWEVVEADLYSEWASSCIEWEVLREFAGLQAGWELN